MTGPNGASGSITLAIPTTVIPTGYHPQITVNGNNWTQVPDNGQPLPSNSWRWNFSLSNYYLYVTLHFSTDDVSITFTKDDAQTSALPQNSVFTISTMTLIAAIAAIAVVVVAVVVLMLRKKRPAGQDLPLPPPPPP
jgi:signal transduction histidine kinase